MKVVERFSRKFSTILWTYDVAGFPKPKRWIFIPIFVLLEISKIHFIYENKKRKKNFLQKIHRIIHHDEIPPYKQTPSVQPKQSERDSYREGERVQLLMSVYELIAVPGWHLSKGNSIRCQTFAALPTIAHVVFIDLPNRSSFCFINLHPSVRHCALQQDFPLPLRTLKRRIPIDSKAQPWRAFRGYGKRKKAMQRQIQWFLHRSLKLDKFGDFAE